jgi:DNA-binding NarL/FixJ family response regulator
MPSVLIVDDHLLIRSGLRQLLSQEYRGLVIREAATAEEAETWLAKRHWDLVILAVALPDKDGFYVLQEIRRCKASTRALLLSMDTEPENVIRARQMGASGYVAKNAARADLLKAIQTVLAGREYFQGFTFTGPEAEPRHDELSTRERGILLALAAGKRTGEIAAELNLSVTAVSTYKRRVLNKLGLHSTADLVRYAIDHRLS